MLIKHVLRHFTKFVKTRFLAKKIRLSAQMSNNAKMPRNIQKTPPTHVKRLLNVFLKTLFSAKKSGSRLRCRTMLKKTHETPRKHQQNMFWGLLRNSWKSGSRQKKSGSRLRFRTMLKYLKTLRKHQLNTLWGILWNFWKSYSWLKNLVLGWDVE